MREGAGRRMRAWIREGAGAPFLRRRSKRTQRAPSPSFPPPPPPTHVEELNLRGLSEGGHLQRAWGGAEGRRAVGLRCSAPSPPPPSTHSP